MNYGLWMSAAGLGSQVHRQSVIANNLSNATTTAFKPDFTQTLERPTAVEEFGQLFTSQQLLEQLGGGVLSEPTWTDFAQGSLEESGNSLDLAIDGPGFFMVRDSQGNDRLTRAGVFQRNRSGHLVNDSGDAVLDARHRPIKLPDIEDGAISITSNGTILVGGDDEVAQIAVVTADASHLRKEGGNLYGFTGEHTPLPAGNETRILQGWTEASGTDPVLEMARMIETSRAIEANARLIGIHDQIMNLTVNRLGAIA